MSAVAINITTTDAKGKSATTKFHVPTGISLNVLDDFAQAAAQLIANLQNGAITELGVSVPIDVSAISATANVLADVAEKAFFMLTGAIQGLFSKFQLPTFNNAYVIAGSDQLDESEIPVSDLLDALENGIAIGAETMVFTDLRDNVLTDVLSSRKIFRKYG